MSDTRRRQAISLINSVGYVQPRLGLVYMCAISSGGGTRYARLPPVIEIIPLRGIACYARHISLRFHAFQTATLIRCAYHILAISARNT